MPLSPSERVEEARDRARGLAARAAAADLEDPGLPGAGPECQPLTSLSARGEAVDEHACRMILAELSAAGLLRYLVPAAFGGESPFVEVAAVAAIREELAYVSGLLDVMFVMQGLGSFPITLAGSEAQRSRCLPNVVAGRWAAAFAVTEPEAGSDVGAMRTTARRVPGGYVLDGVKTFISNAPFADVITVIAQADPGQGKKGLTAFVVERDRPGLEVRGDIELISPHPIGTMEFSGCHLPEESRLGREGEGFSIAMSTLDRFRTTVGAAALGFSRRALDEALRFAASRVQFGRPISEFEGIQFKLADMATKLDASRLLVERAAATADHGERAAAEGAGGTSAGRARTYTLSPLGEDASREASMAKLFATEAAQEIVDEALQIHGARGLVRGAIMERLYRDVRALRIYEGTSEIQRTLIGRSLTGR